MLTVSLVVLAMLFPIQKATSQTATLHVRVTNIKNHEGVIRTLLWNDEDGFPKEKEYFFKKAFHAADADTVSLYFADVPYGDYAISLFQDENTNLEFDKNRLTRTSEPFGLSGKPNFKERPVKFEDCKFRIGKPQTEIIIRLMSIDEVQQIINGEQ